VHLVHKLICHQLLLPTQSLQERMAPGQPPDLHYRQLSRRAMPEDSQWTRMIQHWRSLPLAERRRQHLEAIPRHAANSMAMEGEPVDEAWLRARLASRIRKRLIRLAEPCPPSSTGPNPAEFTCDTPQTGGG